MQRENNPTSKLFNLKDQLRKDNLEKSMKSSVINVMAEDEIHVQQQIDINESYLRYEINKAQLINPSKLYVLLAVVKYLLPGSYIQRQAQLKTIVRDYFKEHAKIDIQNDNFCERIDVGIMNPVNIYEHKYIVYGMDMMTTRRAITTLINYNPLIAWIDTSHALLQFKSAEDGIRCIQECISNYLHQKLEYNQGTKIVVPNWTKFAEYNELVFRRKLFIRNYTVGDQQFIKNREKPQQFYKLYHETKQVFQQSLQNQEDVKNTIKRIEVNEQLVNMFDPAFLRKQKERREKKKEAESKRYQPDSYKHGDNRNDQRRQRRRKNNQEYRKNSMNYVPDFEEPQIKPGYNPPENPSKVLHTFFNGLERRINKTYLQEIRQKRPQEIQKQERRENSNEKHNNHFNNHYSNPHNQGINKGYPNGSNRRGRYRQQDYNRSKQRDNSHHNRRAREGQQDNQQPRHHNHPFKTANINPQHKSTRQNHLFQHQPRRQSNEMIIEPNANTQPVIQQNGVVENPIQQQQRGVINPYNPFLIEEIMANNQHIEDLSSIQDMSSINHFSKYNPKLQNHSENPFLSQSNSSAPNSLLNNLNLNSNSNNSHPQESNNNNLNENFSFCSPDMELVQDHARQPMNMTKRQLNEQFFNEYSK